VESSTDNNRDKFLIGVVGVCASGKSTLIEGLTGHGYRARHIAQEHSYVKDMWKRTTNPDILIFLDVTFEESLKRRLSHAREHAHLNLDTTPLSIGEVLERVLTFIEMGYSQTKPGA